MMNHFGRRITTGIKQGQFKSQKRAYTTINAANKSKRSFITGLGLTVAAGFTLYGINRFLNDEEQVVFAKEAEKPNYELAQSTTITGMHPHGAFVTITLSENADLNAILKAAAKLPDYIEEINIENGKKEPLTVMAGVSFGTQVWEKVAQLKKQKLPENFSHHAPSRKGNHGDIPATGGDLFFHVKAESTSLCFQTVKYFFDSLPQDSIQSIDDNYGWQFMEGRDLSGFIDGTENPGDRETRRQAALLPTGGSYAIHQKWVHRLREFHAKPEDEQEKIIGRTKPDSAELTGNDLTTYSHVVRTRDAKGNKIPIVRQSMPFGTLGGNHGLLFCAYANNPQKFDTMLDRMVGKGGEESDATMTFSKCISSQFYYTPSIPELKALSK